MRIEQLEIIMSVKQGQQHSLLLDKNQLQPEKYDNRDDCGNFYITFKSISLMKDFINENRRSRSECSYWDVQIPTEKPYQLTKEEWDFFNTAKKSYNKKIVAMKKWWNDPSNQISYN